ncbi:nuclear pore complex protein Nup214-like isoform X2 [Asterias rubens]|uniref:nuclear pore complex protein Nup214-like isoform X2 n=1 Tax=Asterias rubens TaxID=7604 RepID=UPI0014554034|nr:nuclear pore complex protein Nup214-like isoform X2 [Asterias rubens]
MMAEAGPPEKDAPFLKFHQLTQLQIYDDQPTTLEPKERLNLLAVSNEYGYTFVGCNSAIKILRTSDIRDCTYCNDPNAASRVSDYNCSKVELNANPVHLALNADNLVLSACTMTETNLMVALFDVRSLVRGGSNVSPFASVPLSKEPSMQLVNLAWNPVHASCFATCLSDGSMALWDSSGDNIARAFELPEGVNIKAMCWSPKGKQIVLGTSSGELVQYNQKLDIKKTIRSPDFTTEQVKVVDILWLSTYMFAVAYLDAEETLHPNLAIVNAPKEGPPTFLNFEDVCYGSEQLRSAQYQLQNFEKWSFLVAVSSNAIEAAVLGRSPVTPSTWEVWTVDDSSRIELPLTGDDKETYPMGIALDLSLAAPFELNNKKYHPPPMLMVLSTEGVLCPYYVLNADASEAITARAQPLPVEGEKIGRPSLTQPQIPRSAPQAVPTQPLQVPRLTPQAPPQAPQQAPQQAPPQTPPEQARPLSTIPASAPIHKSSSTGSFSHGPKSTSSTSSLFNMKPNQTDRSASFSFSSPKQPTPTTGPSTFSAGGLFGKPTVSSSTPAIFSFGSKPDEAKAGSAVGGKASFPFVAPKAVPAGSSLSQGGAQGLSEQGRFVQQPASTYQGSPQAAQSPGGAGPGSLFGDLKSQHPASSSAFSLSQQKTPAGANALSGGVQPTDSVKDSNSAPSLKTSGFGNPTPRTSPGKAPLGSEPKSGLFSFAPSSQVASQANQFGSAPPNRVAPPSGYPNQVAPSGDGLSQRQNRPPAYPGVVPQNEVASRSGVPPNQVAPQPGVLPNQVAPQPGVPQNQVAPLPAYSTQSPSSAKQQPGQAVPEYKPTPTAQAPPPEAAPEESGARPRGKVAFTGSAVDLAYFSNIKEEREHFMKEMLELENHTKNANFRVGERSELTEMKKAIDDLLKFKSKVLDITKSDNEEIHEIKAKFLSTFAQLEDARIRKQRNNDPRYLQLLRSRALDPQTAHQLRDIHSNYHYLKTGLGDVSGCLDAQWEDFNKRKSRREGRKLGTPMMDTIYQTLSHHYNIVITQRGKLEKLRQQLIQARRYDMSEAPWERGILPSPPERSGNLSSLAAKLSSTTISSPTKTRSTPVSSKKQAQLRKALSRRATTPRRTASKMDISEMSSLNQSYSSPPGAFANRRLQFHEEESPVAPPPASRLTTSSVDSPDVRTGRGITQARVGGSLERVAAAPSSQIVDEKRSEAGRHVERKHAMPYVSSPLPIGKPSSTNPALPETSSPSSFIHSGRGTVVWGTKTTPVKSPPSTRVSSSGAIPKKSIAKTAELPPVVNVKNINAMKESMPPPVTFAPVSSTMDEGTAKVINQVLAEINHTSGHMQPEPSDQNEQRVSFSNDPSPVAQSVQPSKPFSMLGASRTPAPQSTAPSTSTIPPHVGLSFGAQGSLFGAKRDSSSAVVSNSTLAAKGSLPSFQGLASPNVTAPKPGLGSAESASLGGTSSWLASSASVQQTPAGVKPNLFDFNKDQKAAASTSTPGGFFVASTTKDPSQESTETVNASGGSSTATTDTTPFKSSQKPSFGVKAIITAPPSTSVVEPTPTVAAVPAFGSSFGQGTAKPFSATAPKAPSSGLKQLLQQGEDEAGTGLAKPSTSGLFGKPSGTLVEGSTSTEGGQTANIQPQGVDEAGIRSPINASDVTDHPTPATSSMTFSTPGSAAPTTTSTTGLFGKPSGTPVEGSTGTAGGMFGSKPAGASIFGATSSTSTSSAPAAGFGNPSFGSAPTFEKTPSTGLFSASSSGFSFAPSATPATTTTAASETAKTKPQSLFGLLKDDTPTTLAATSTSSLFGSTTSGSTAAKSLFGQPTSTSTSLFGQPPSSTSGVFGQPASPASTSGLFGKPTSTTASSGVGPFGSPAATTASMGGTFGQASSASPFQQTAASGPFGTSSTFGQQSPGGLFGQASTSAPAFGQSPSVFAQSSSTTSTSVFGGAGGDGGGGFFSGLGGRPNPEAARTNPFGTPSAFGTSAGNTSIFGGQGATSFSSGSTPASTNTASVFGGGFSNSGGGVAKAGFGVTQQTSASSGFGGAPSFGSPPAFGSTPSFGGSTFGNPAGFSASPFGQPSSFGASPSAPTSAAPANGFTGFASQDTPTFGSLSTATTQQTQPTFGGGGFGGGGGAGFGGGFGGNTNPPSGGTGFGSNTNTSSGGSSSFMQYR